MRPLQAMLLASALVVCASAHADDHADADRSVASAVRLRTEGKVFTVVGSALAQATSIVGPLAYVSDHAGGNAECARICEPRPTFSVWDGVSVGLAVSSAALLAVGLELWTVGDARATHAQLRLGAARLSLR